MIHVDKEQAPLGLDFEWPENLWLWRYSDGRRLVRVINEHSLVVLSEQPKGLVSYHRDPTVEWSGDGDKWDGGPEPFDPGEPSYKTHGFYLVNENGKEIARRYVK